jgi:glycosyltransferase involved in cell wall biosynthesis
MDLSVAICTFNRASILEDTLESFLQVARPEGVSVELLIVDNNSSDDTPRIAKAFADRHSGLVRVIREPATGLSHARNAGIAAARGDIIAFADDDVYFDREWVIALLSAFSQDAAAQCVGGQSVPLFEGGQPDWISSALLPVYGSTNSGDEMKIMQFPEHPFGLNMAFRRAVFDVVGTFNTRLGRSGSSLLSNEESELFHRVSRAGLKVIYTPRAVVRHRIPRARAEKRYLLRRNYWQGVSDVILRESHGRSPRRELVRNAAREIRKTTWYLRFLLRRVLVRRGGEDKPSFMEWLGLTYRLGTIRQILREIVSPTTQGRR